MLSQALVVALLSVAVSACTGTISSLSDVTAAVACTTINVNGFTVPAGSTFTLSLLAETTVNIRKDPPSFSHRLNSRTCLVGDISFGEKLWAGPLFSIRFASFLMFLLFHNHNAQNRSEVVLTLLVSRARILVEIGFVLMTVQSTATATPSTATGSFTGYAAGVEGDFA
jgi:hypothetical protein